MAISYKTVANPVAVDLGEVVVYNLFRNDDVNGCLLTYWFTTSKYGSETDEYAFDVRDLASFKCVVDFALNDPELFRQCMQSALDRGEIDPVEYKETEEPSDNQIKISESLTLTRAECVESLRILRDECYKLKRNAEPEFVRYPDLDALLEHIDQHGLSPKES